MEKLIGTVNMKKHLIASLALMFMLMACASSSDLTAIAMVAPTLASYTETTVPTAAPPTETFTPTLPPPTATSTSTATAIPVVESLKASVTADLLSCRYGPGAEYLYLYALRRTANIELIGRTDGNNWVMVKGKNLCWVNAKFLEIAGDPKTLKVMYPDGYKIPVSPYYSAPIVLSAVRDPDNGSMVTVEWTDIALRAGDEEDESMFIYIIEIWRCEGGQMIFDPLAANYPQVTFVDEAGCSLPSHGRVYFQEKHGFAGPAEIPWPAQ
jgi:uncharacterized protein YraI